VIEYNPPEYEEELMAEEKGLAVVEQKEVTFYEDAIVAVRLADSSIYIPVKPICDLLGVDWGGQYRRIQRDPVLSEEIRPIDVTSTRRGTQPMVCLPLDYISGFLFGLNADRVKSELRERVILYQRECYKALAEAFQEGRLTAEPSFDELLTNDTPAAQAYKIAAAIMKMARQQLLLESQLETHTARLSDHEERLERVEEQLGDRKQHVTPEQAMQISQAVKAVAHELGKKTKSNQYGGVYGELYRRYGINSYKSLPKKKFNDAIKWLNEWLQSLIDETPF
jgi:ferritin-like metal-binding protein YciE